MLRIVIVIILVAGSSAIARAGDCSGGGNAFVGRYEAYAKGGKDKPDSSLCFEQEVVPSAALTKRFLAACDTILTREPYPDCVRGSITLGAKRLGGKDAFDELLRELPLKLYSFSIVELYDRLDDPRAVEPILAAWKTGLADPRSSHDNVADDWARWRHAAARVLGRHGKAGERAFLEDCARSAKDRGVRKACQAAGDEIAKRLAP